MKNDKQKMMVLGALALGLVGVGVFQVAGGGSDPAPAAQPSKPVAQKSSSPATGATPQLAGGALPEKPSDTDPALATAAVMKQRDPFDGSRFVPATATQQMPPTPPPAAETQVAAMPRPEIGGSVGTLPVIPSGLGGPGIEPGEKLPNPDEFAYIVSGVITGERPAAVFTDELGNQRLVALGGSIDGDSKLIAVSRGKVTVQHRGKKKTFTVVGN
jgi:hypothetical protein